MPERGASRWWAWLFLSALVIVLDQITKHVIQQSVSFGSPVHVTAFLDLVLVYNPGAAFSFLSTAPGWQRELFIAIAVAAAMLIVYLLRRHRADRLFCFALSLILGGAIGNLIDRVMLGAVVDFLHFHLGQSYFPAFNVADSAITCGAGLLIWDSLRRSKTRPQTH
jgi:signal peptidase II